MDSAIVVALVTAIGGIVAAGIAAYSASKQAIKKEVGELRKELATTREQLIRNQVKVDTLWDVYAEDAIRSAQRGGLLAAKSAVRPTDKLLNKIPSNLMIDIEVDTLRLAEIMTSPHDVSIELWAKYKRDLIDCAVEEDMSIKECWGSLITLVQNILYDHGYVELDELYATIMRSA